MTAELTLHYAPDNASLCVRLALEECGFPYQTRLVDRALKAQKSAAYLKLNPNGLIPTLETPAGVIYETGAILLWLADQNPGAMFPRAESPERGRALTRLFWLSNTVHPALRMLFYPGTFTSGCPDGVREKTISHLMDYINQINAYPDLLLTGQPDICSCYLAPFLRWCALYGGDTAWFDLAQWPHLLTFAQTFENRPAARRAAVAEGLGSTPFSSPVFPTPPEGSPT